MVKFELVDVLGCSWVRGSGSDILVEYGHDSIDLGHILLLFLCLCVCM